MPRLPRPLPVCTLWRMTITSEMDVALRLTAAVLGAVALLIF
jgi:hypothetical protein